MAIQNASINFVQGVAGYSGIQDTQINQGNANTSYGNAGSLSVDSSPVQQGLLRFDSIFSASAVPLGAQIVSATLTLQTTNAGNGGSFHRMLKAWSEASTWNSMSAGVSADGVEAVQAADASSGAQTVGTSIVDVTASVQAWSNGATNYGWLINSLGSNGWDFSTSEGSFSPRLTINYSYDDGLPPPANTAPVAVNDTATVTRDGSVVINVLSNDRDANNDTLVVSNIAALPEHGTVAIVNNRITYTPTAGYTGTDSFSYTISDGRGGSSTASVAVSVTPPSPVPVERTVTFKQGVGGYTGIQDTQLTQGSANSSLGNAASMIIDSSPTKQGLLRFDNIISASGVPQGATIVSATLTLETTNAGSGGAFHRMLKSWSEASTWNSMSSGVAANGVEAVQTADVSSGKRSIGTSTIDVTSSVQAWANGAANYGWLIKSLGSDAWYISTSESGASPVLTVRYTVANTSPPPSPVNTPPTAVNDSATVKVDGSVAIDVLLNDTDADRDALTVTGINAGPAHGTVAIGADNKITYTPDAGYAGTDSFIYKISDNRGGTSTATVNVDVKVPPPLEFDSTYGYLALSNASGSTSNFEHTNASKTFFHDGTWWAILPANIQNAGGVWSIYKYDESIPSPGAQGGWSIASDPLLSSANHVDIAFSEATGHLFVLMYAKSSATPYLLDLTYNTQADTWSTAASVNLATRLDPNVYGSNVDLALHVDQYGNPMIVAVNDGPAQGLYVATTSASNYNTWTSTLLDANTTSSGGSNGNSKADFVNFDINGQKVVGIVYSQDNSADSWRFAWHDASAAPSGYTANWKNETITTGVSIDDHVSAMSADGKIFAAIKDASNALWLLSGSPGHWETPIRIVSGGQSASRPVITLDDTNDRIYVTYQQSSSPGDVYLKIADMNNPVFNSAASGMKIIQGNGSADKFINPQGPAHAVGDDTDGYFPIMVREDDGSHVWWNGVSLGHYDLIA